nr:hypothetical protein JVH1_0239 [Rhodococcus sp. JVH1]
MNSGARGFQAKVDEALASLAGVHESGRTWTTEWTPSQGPLVMRLVAAVPTGVEYPFALVGGDLRHLPYATGAADLTMFWDVSTSSNRPHCVIVGPTGGGKGFVIRTVLTEAVRRGIPFVGVDPKMIELDGTRGLPRLWRDGVGRAPRGNVRACAAHRDDGPQRLHSPQEDRGFAATADDRGPRRVLHSLRQVAAAGEDGRRRDPRATRERLEELDPRAESDPRVTRERLEELDPLGAWAACSVSRRSGRFSVRRRQR